MTSELGVRTVHGLTTDLSADPIPEDWVLDGDPQARSVSWLVHSDGLATSFVWDCTAGTFRWYFAGDETAHVIAGAVTISTEGQPPTRLEVGDAAYFPAGTWSTWQVDDYVRKHAIVRPPVSRAVRKLVGVRGHRKHRLR